MSKERTSIHEFDISLICEYFSVMERQGPGSPEATLKALGFTDNLNHDSQIADIGCGTGGQTMILAGNTPGRITGLDLFPAFIDIFNSNAAKLGYSDRVTGITGSMENLPFGNEELDLIWSEGSIYNIGFERGINEWRRFLKRGAFIAVSEASWFTRERPAEIEEFWMDAYPGIDTVANKTAQMEKAGYIPVASFILPESCWTDNFYLPQKEAREIFLGKYAGNKAAEAFLASEEYEADLYSRFREYYGYAFYIGRKF